MSEQNPNQQISAWKKAQRQQLLEQRAALPAAEREQMGGVVIQSVLTELSQVQPTELSLYWPIKSEIDCRPITNALLQAGWLLSVPIIDSATKRLIFARWTPDCEMEVGTWNIPIPRHIEHVEPEVMLIPLVGFDTSGYRLGYGGGYYDRTLEGKSESKIKIGIGYAFSELASIHPHQFDIKMDMIITDAGCRHY